VGNSHWAVILFDFIDILFWAVFEVAAPVTICDEEAVAFESICSNLLIQVSQHRHKTQKQLTDKGNPRIIV